MKLSLDHNQRLNLHALMGAQRVPLNDLRMLWKLQDRIELSDDEKKAINYRTFSNPANGMQQVGWDSSKSLPPADYEFSQDEFDRIVKLMGSWESGFLTQGDRQWLEPLMEQLDHLKNGSK